ncbi:MAG: hypothetical protein GON13_01150 [Nanoarchaeota archaeon]|nr:hypothetical protein [Nanoarchaeota archaeon]
MKFDIQVHSRFSHCANMNVKKLLEKMDLLGFDYVFITDHNTMRFHKYNKYKQILPGIEVKTIEGEILGLYVQEKIKKGLSVEETIDKIHEQGGLAIPSHPFDKSREHFKHVNYNFDAIEIFNGRVIFQKHNLQALNNARGFVKLAGSDSHFVSEFGKCYNTSPFDDPYKSIKTGKVKWHGSFNGISGHVKTALHKKLGLSVE